MMLSSKRVAGGTSYVKKKKKKEWKKYEENWIHILHLKSLKVEEDDACPLEGVMFKIDGYAEKAINDQLYHRTSEESKKFLESMCMADKVLKITGGNNLNSDGYQHRCPYWPLDTGNTESDLKDFLEKEVIPAILETGKMRKDSSFVLKSYTVVNHLTDVVAYNDDLKHVIRNFLADDHGNQEANFFKASKNNLCCVFKPGHVPLEVMHSMELTEDNLLADDAKRQKEAIEEAESLDVFTPEKAGSADSPNFNRSL